MKTILDICLYRKVTTVFFLLISLSLSAQETDKESVYSNYNKKEYMIPMRDGIRLFTAVYCPKTPDGNNPMLIVRTPYSCSPYGEEEMSPSLWNTYAREYLKEGYIMVMQDVRGKWLSEGEFVDVRPFILNKKSTNDIDEASDAYDTVEWLLENIEGNNGNVGFYGCSYPGFYATMAAASDHPAIKAVSPQAPIFDWFMGDDFHHNGAFMLCDAASFFSRHGIYRPEPTMKAAKRIQYQEGDIYSFFLKTGTIKNLTSILGDSLRFWNDMTAHPDYDNWWKERSASEACKNISSAVLVTGGLFDTDDLYGIWNTYKTMVKYNPGKDIRLAIGPWAHCGAMGSNGSYLGDIKFGDKTAPCYQQTVEIPFFNYYLKGKGLPDNLNRVKVFFTGENKWRTFDKWPADSYKPTAIYLQKGGCLGFEISKDEDSYTEYTSDPANPVPFMNGELKSRPKEYMLADQRFATKRDDVLSFETGILEEEITLGGPVVIDLQVSVSSTDADFVVKLIDVFPDETRDSLYIKTDKMKGYQMLVRGDVMRGKYRNSFESPKPFVPNKITQVKFELQDIAHTFKEGHKIMIQIQSSWFPLVDRNPQQYIDIYHCDEEDFMEAEIKIFHNRNNLSQVILPVFK